MLFALALLGCSNEGCLGGGDDCQVEPACEDLQFSCDGGSATSYRLEAGFGGGGNFSVASPGDWVLENRRVRVVISDLDHPHFLAPTGGNIVDMGTFADDGSYRDDDSVRNIYHVGGLLPTEAMSYTSIRAYSEGTNAIVQVSGTYDDDPLVQVHTRYEMGPCDPGVRVRTELINLHADPESVFLADAHYIGGRESLSFAPGEGLGFNHPSFGLASLVDGLVPVPWVAAGAHESPGSTVSFTSCDDDTITALMSEEISAMGKPPTLLRYGDYLTYERFLGVGTGADVSAGSDIALDVRAQLRGDESQTITGTLDGELTGRPQIRVFRGDVPLDADLSMADAVTHVEGRNTFAFDVSGSGTFTAVLERFGLPWSRVSFEGSSFTLPNPDAGHVRINATRSGVADHALVVVWPADEETLAAVQTDYLDHFETCAPMLGHPYGSEPSCNRLLVNGPTDLDLPAGTYDFFSVAGPFSTLASARGVVVEAGGARVDIDLATDPLPLIENGLTADFHVHGSASFDSSIPDDDRVRAMLASDLDIITATDHDKVNNYAEALAELDPDGRMEVLVGLETTGHILQNVLESSPFPQVVGHWIVWPIPYDPEGPWRGAPWDEKAQPGGLFTRFQEAGWPADTGVVQLNHPWGGIQFGRDFGWATTLGLDLNTPLDGDDLPEGHQLFGATPPGSSFANDAYHVQEVMNGTNNGQFLQYRAIWHYLLNQGRVRGGTANSDSHTLGGNILGFPQNVVFTDQTLGSFDQPAFNRAVRAGQSFGTNGPVLDVQVEQAGTIHRPRIDATIPLSGTLTIDVSSASWIPVEEIRVYVDGLVAQTLAPTLSPDPTRPGIQAVTLTLAVDDLVSGEGDHWIVVEAGAPLVEFADFDCNGVPDTDDNNGDGVVDWRDIEAYAELTAAPETDDGCFDEVGPLDGVIDPLGLPPNDFAAVVPGGYPLAFTNPILIDGNNDGTFEGVQ